MKTTNYELSKKLADIGFLNTDYAFGYNKSGSWLHDEKTEDKNIVYPSYDLGTIFEALPNALINQDKTKLSKKTLTYDLGIKIGYLEVPELILYQDQNESMADTVARLLILLHEQGLVKFGGENENL